MINPSHSHKGASYEIQYADGSEELYDHTNDPYEWTNLASNPDSLKVIKELRRHLPARNAQAPKSKVVK